MGLAEDIQKNIAENQKLIEKVASNAERNMQDHGMITQRVFPDSIVPKEIEDLGDDGKPNGKKLLVDAHTGIHILPDSEKPIGQGGLGPRKHPPHFTLKDRISGASGESRLESK